ncbi:unannotated protein [freshwater metagenome]|uniref:Unannotated protein n=1 Tax=freshwater metagenome TaxID=449393 RepID=A0A6J6IHP2_9ZZZZ
MLIPRIAAISKVGVTNSIVGQNSAGSTVMPSANAVEAKIITIATGVAQTVAYL